MLPQIGLQSAQCVPGAVAGKILEAANEPDLGAPQRLSFVEDSLYQQARKLKADLPEADDTQGIEALLSQARQQAALDIPQAVEIYKSALSLNPENGALWAELSSVEAKVENNYQILGEAPAAALNAYQLSRTQGARLAALNRLAQAFEKGQNYRAALNAYKASLALSDVCQDAGGL